MGGGPPESRLTQVSGTPDLASGCWSGPRQTGLTSARWGSSGPTFTLPASEPVFLTGLRISLHMRGAGSRMGGQHWAPNAGQRVMTKGLLEVSLNHKKLSLLPLEWSSVLICCMQLLQPSFHQADEAKVGWWSREETFVSFMGSGINPLHRTPAHVRLNSLAVQARLR